MSVLISRRFTWLLLVSCALAGCSKDQADGNNAWSFSQSVTSDWQRVLGKIKRIPESSDDKAESLFKQFKIETQVADDLMSGSLANDEEFKVRFVEMRNKIIINHYLNDVIPLSITDDQIKQYYESHRDEFSESQYHLARLILTGKSTQDVADILGSINADLSAGKTFPEVVSLYSQDAQSRAAGGDIGWVNANALPKPVLDAISPLAVGGHTDALQEGDAVVIYQLVEVKKVSEVALSEAVDRVNKKLVRELQESKKKELNLL